MSLFTQRRMDELGRVVIPMEMRRALSLESGATLNMYCQDAKIILESDAACCKLCHRGGALLTPACDALLCSDCIAHIKEL